MIFTGGCQCGTIRYEIESKPIVAYCCHCLDCQLQSSSAFGISVWFPAAAFKVTSGTLVNWTTQADSGNEKSCTLCPECGTRIYHGDPNGADALSVKGGSLDNINTIFPVAQIWTKSAQPWVLKLIADELCFDTQPENFDALIALFQESENRLAL